MPLDVAQIRENREAWEAIADSFHSTRNKPWSAVEEFVASLPTQARVLDIGCGNGRHARLATARGLPTLGLDLSRRLLEHARRSVSGAPSDWLEGVIERIPLRDASVDAVLGLAVIHHVRGRAARIGALRECMRVLRPGGRALFSVWSREQPRFGPGREPAKPVGGAEPEEGDAMLRWTHHRLNVPRFIHLYTWAEWRRELDETYLPVERAWPESIMTDEAPDNYFAILRKR